MAIKIFGDNIALSEIQKLKAGQINTIIAKITDPEIVKKIEELSNLNAEDEMEKAMLVTEITTMIQKQQDEMLQVVAELTTMISTLAGGAN